MKNNRLTKSIFFVMLVTLFSGCNSWLNLEPENRQTSAMYWNTKEDVEAVVNSGYTRMKGCLERFVQWGEIRGDGLTLSAKATGHEQDIVELEILTDNSIANWAPFYKVIASANAVIEYSETVLEKDKSFTAPLCRSYIAEAKFQRALMYFYLVRTFHQVPLILKAYVDDTEEFMVAKNTEREILDQIIADLEWCKDKIKPGYGNNESNKGRATTYAVHALLADVYLWDEQYDKAITSCDFILNSGMYELMDKLEFYALFNPAYSDESIFELAYTHTQNNSLFGWYTGSPRYSVSLTTEELFKRSNEVDYRGLDVSYKSDMTVWKFSGTAAVVDGGIPRPSDRRNSNWIFYRLAEIYLMKAEALVMSGRNKDAFPYYKEVRERAGFAKHPAFSDDRFQALSLIMDERQVEFLGEGKRWFDILRVAKRNNYQYRDYLLDVVLENTSAQKRPIYAAKLKNELGYFLPIHKSQIEMSDGLLLQNDYYKDVD